MNRLRPVICVCLLSAMLMAPQALSPGIPQLMELYGISESAASLSITIPYLISIPFTLLAGKLARKYSLKMLLLIGAFLICITGLLPYILDNYMLILIIRGCMGIGLGLLFTLTPNMASAYYPEGRLRNLTIGMQSAWAGSGGFVFNILSGNLVQRHSRYIYLVYFLCVLFTVSVCFLLPVLPRKQKEEKSRSVFAVSSLFTAFLTFLFLAAGMTLSLSISLFMAEQKIGGPVEAGYATSAYSAAAFIFGCLYVFLSGILKNKAVITACLISLLGMFLCVSGGSLIFIYAGAFLLGAGLSLFMPGCISNIIRTTPPEATAMSIAVMMVGSSIGQTFSGMVVNSLAGAFTDRIAARFYVSAALFAFVAILSVLFTKKEHSGTDT